MANELFVLHLEGEILSTKKILEIEKKYRGKNNVHWYRRPPKPFYTSEKTAKARIHYLPKSIRNKIIIVRYVPEETK